MVKQSFNGLDNVKVVFKRVGIPVFASVLAMILFYVAGIEAASYVYSGDVAVRVELLNTDQLRGIAIAVFGFGVLCTICTVVGIVRGQRWGRLVSVVCFILCLILLRSYYFDIIDAQADFML